MQSLRIVTYNYRLPALLFCLFTLLTTYQSVGKGGSFSKNESETSSSESENNELDSEDNESDCESGVALLSTQIEQLQAKLHNANVLSNLLEIRKRILEVSIEIHQQLSIQTQSFEILEGTFEQSRHIEFLNKFKQLPSDLLDNETQSNITRTASTRSYDSNVSNSSTLSKNEGLTIGDHLQIVKNCRQVLEHGLPHYNSKHLLIHTRNLQELFLKTLKIHSGDRKLFNKCLEFAVARHRHLYAGIQLFKNWPTDTLQKNKRQQIIMSNLLTATQLYSTSTLHFCRFIADHGVFSASRKGTELIFKEPSKFARIILMFTHLPVLCKTYLKRWAVSFEHTLDAELNAWLQEQSNPDNSAKLVKNKTLSKYFRFGKQMLLPVKFIPLSKICPSNLRAEAVDKDVQTARHNSNFTNLNHTQYLELLHLPLELTSCELNQLKELVSEYATQNTQKETKSAISDMFLQSTLSLELALALIKTTNGVSNKPALLGPTSYLTVMAMANRSLDGPNDNIVDENAFSQIQTTTLCKVFPELAVDSVTFIESFRDSSCKISKFLKLLTQITTSTVSISFEEPENLSIDFTTFTSGKNLQESTQNQELLSQIPTLIDSLKTYFSKQNSQLALLFNMLQSTRNQFLEHLFLCESIYFDYCRNYETENSSDQPLTKVEEKFKKLEDSTTQPALNHNSEFRLCKNKDQLKIYALKNCIMNLQTLADYHELYKQHLKSFVDFVQNGQYGETIKLLNSIKKFWNWNTTPHSYTELLACLHKFKQQHPEYQYELKPTSNRSKSSNLVIEKLKTIIESSTGSFANIESVAKNYSPLSYYKQIVEQFAREIVQPMSQVQDIPFKKTMLSQFIEYLKFVNVNFEKLRHSIITTSIPVLDTNIQLFKSIIQFTELTDSKERLNLQKKALKKISLQLSQYFSGTPTTETKESVDLTITEPSDLQSLTASTSQAQTLMCLEPLSFVSEIAPIGTTPQADSAPNGELLQNSEMYDTHLWYWQVHNSSDSKAQSTKLVELCNNLQCADGLFGYEQDVPKNAFNNFKTVLNKIIPLINNLQNCDTQLQSLKFQPEQVADLKKSLIKLYNLSKVKAHCPKTIVPTPRDMADQRYSKFIQTVLDTSAKLCFPECLTQVTSNNSSNLGSGAKESGAQLDAQYKFWLKLPIIFADGLLVHSKTLRERYFRPFIRYCYAQILDYLEFLKSVDYSELVSTAPTLTIEAVPTTPSLFLSQSNIYLGLSQPDSTNSKTLATYMHIKKPLYLSWIANIIINGSSPTSDYQVETLDNIGYKIYLKNTEMDRINSMRNYLQKKIKLGLLTSSHLKIIENYWLEINTLNSDTSNENLQTELLSYCTVLNMLLVKTVKTTKSRDTTVDTDLQYLDRWSKISPLKKILETKLVEFFVITQTNSDLQHYTLSPEIVNLVNQATFTPTSLQRSVDNSKQELTKAEKTLIMKNLVMFAKVLISKNRDTLQESSPQFFEYCKAVTLPKEKTKMINHLDHQYVAIFEQLRPELKQEVGLMSCYTLIQEPLFIIDTIERIVAKFKAQFKNFQSLQQLKNRKTCSEPFPEPGPISDTKNTQLIALENLRCKLQKITRVDPKTENPELVLVMETMLQHVRVGIEGTLNELITKQSVESKNAASIADEKATERMASSFHKRVVATLDDKLNSLVLELSRFIKLRPNMRLKFNEQLKTFKGIVDCEEFEAIDQLIGLSRYHEPPSEGPLTNKTNTQEEILLEHIRYIILTHRDCLTSESTKKEVTKLLMPLALLSEL